MEIVLCICALFEENVNIATILERKKKYYISQ